MIMDCKVRLLEINVKNLKNLGNGSICFDSYSKVLKGKFDFEESDIVGVYGPNGSSKSSLIDALSIIKSLFINDPLDHELYDYISINKDKLELSLKLYCCLEKNHYIIDYNVYLNKMNNEQIKISYEEINYRKYESNDWTKQKSLFSINNNVDGDGFIMPKHNLMLLMKNNSKILFNLFFLKGKKESSNLSFLLSKEFKDILYSNKDLHIFSLLLDKLNLYFKYCCHLYDNKKFGNITAKNVIPFFYKEEYKQNISMLYGELSLNDNSFIKECHLKAIKNSINNINVVLSKIIEGMEIEIEELGRSKDENGELCINYILISRKKDYYIPLKFESDGIKKIISILFSLIDAFNNPYSILIIDELDSGIYEYLLGIILDLFKEKGEGQLLFTSHNLRALEVIKDNIIFTTNNEYERFSKIKYVKPTNNLRNVYLRNLYLKNDDEFNVNIDEYDLYRAFIEVGDMFNYDKEE